MAVSSDLFRLIKALTKSEKGYFKKYAYKSINAADNIYLKIFDAIDGQEEYDEQKWVKKFSNELKGKQISSVKNYLQKLIISSLKNYRKGNSPRDKLHELFKEIEIYRDKCLVETVFRKIAAAKKLALRHEYFEELVKLCDIEMLYIIEQRPSGSHQLLCDIQKEQEAAIEKWHSIHQYLTLYWKMYLLQWKYALGDEKEAEEAFDALSNHPLIQSFSGPETFNGKRLYLNILEEIYNHRGQYRKTYEVIILQLKLMESYPDSINDKPNNYIYTFHNALIACNNARYYDPVPGLLEKLKSFQTSDLYLQTIISEIYYENYLIYCIHTRNINRGLELIDEMLDEIKSKNALTFHQYLSIQHSCAILYFMAEDYHSCLDWVNKALDHEEKQLVYPNHYSIRVLECLAHYELGNYDLMESLARSIYRYIKKTDYYTEFDRQLIWLLKKLSERIPENETLEILKTTYRKIHALPHPLHFDITWWLETKLNGKSN